MTTSETQARLTSKPRPADKARRRANAAYDKAMGNRDRAAEGEGDERADHS